jgi:hypothetical protein
MNASEETEDKIGDISTISECSTTNSLHKKSRVTFYLKSNSPTNDEHPSVDASKTLYNQIISNIDLRSDENQQNTAYLTSKTRNESSSNKYRKKCVYFKELKYWIYMMLEKPTGHLALVHRLFTFSIILLTILFSAFTTMEPIKDWSENALFYIEFFVTFYFFVEYLLRIWSSDCRPIYRGIKAKLKFMIRPIMVIELLAFIFGVILIIGSSHTRKFSDTPRLDQSIYFGPIALTILRFLQLVRLLYVDRKAHTWIILLDVCYKHKFELISSVYIGFITLLLSSYLIYHCEKSVPDSKFRSYSDAVYWSIITMTTIGYGNYFCY